MEDLLLVSRISDAKSPAREVRLDVADLAALVTRSAGDFAGAGGAPGTAERLTVRTPAEPLPVRCDPVRVVQVVGNLVSNALKYSAEGSPVLVEVLPDGDGVVVAVTDSGRGIPSDQLEQVFDKFHRVEDALRMTTGGTGLGLFIARELTHAMRRHPHASPPCWAPAPRSRCGCSAPPPTTSPRPPSGAGPPRPGPPRADSPASPRSAARPDAEVAGQAPGRGDAEVAGQAPGRGRPPFAGPGSPPPGRPPFGGPPPR